MTDKHTPGPWAPDTEGFDASIIGPDGKLIIAGEYDGWMVPFACRDEAVANIRLVVAAPDLLEMLKEAELWINDECELRGDDDAAYESPAANMVAHIRAAIRKATGGKDAN